MYQLLLSSSEEEMKQKKTGRAKLEGEHPRHGKIVRILIPKPLDMALLPIGGAFTMDIQEAVKAAMAIAPK